MKAPVVAAWLAAALAVAPEARAAKPFDPGEDRAGRIALEAGGGVVGAVAGGVAGGALGCALHEGGGMMGCLGPAMIGMVAGAWVGNVHGVVGAGALAGANGSYGWTWVGALGGLATGLGTIALTIDLDDAPQVVGMILGAVVLPIGGTVAGYELSTRRRVGASRSAAASTPLVVRIAF
ncbi:MAG: hypothetical protein IT376_06135 [Polyangiaceae bacterium]|nr:hypothetical protein [Polyangiaceae bacterium]